MDDSSLAPANDDAQTPATVDSVVVSSSSASEINQAMLSECSSSAEFSLPESLENKNPAVSRGDDDSQPSHSVMSASPPGDSCRNSSNELMCSSMEEENSAEAQQLGADSHNGNQNQSFVDLEPNSSVSESASLRENDRNKRRLEETSNSEAAAKRFKTDDDSEASKLTCDTVLSDLGSLAENSVLLSDFTERNKDQHATGCQVLVDETPMEFTLEVVDVSLDNPTDSTAPPDLGATLPSCTGSEQSFVSDCTARTPLLPANSYEAGEPYPLNIAAQEEKLAADTTVVSNERGDRLNENDEVTSSSVGFSHDDLNLPRAVDPETFIVDVDMSSARHAQASEMPVNVAENGSFKEPGLVEEQLIPKELDLPIEEQDVLKELDLPKVEQDVPKELDLPIEEQDVPKELDLPKAEQNVPKELDLPKAEQNVPKEGQNASKERQDVSREQDVSNERQDVPKGQDIEREQLASEEEKGVSKERQDVPGDQDVPKAGQDMQGEQLTSKEEKDVSKEGQVVPIEEEQDMSKDIHSSSEDGSCLIEQEKVAEKLTDESSIPEDFLISIEEEGSSTADAEIMIDIQDSPCTTEPLSAGDGTGTSAPPSGAESVANKADTVAGSESVELNRDSDAVVESVASSNVEKEKDTDRNEKEVSTSAVEGTSGEKKHDTLEGMDIEGDCDDDIADAGVSEVAAGSDAKAAGHKIKLVKPVVATRKRSIKGNRQQKLVVVQTEVESNQEEGWNDYNQGDGNYWQNWNYPGYNESYQEHGMPPPLMNNPGYGPSYSDYNNRNMLSAPPRAGMTPSQPGMPMPPHGGMPQPPHGGMPQPPHGGMPQPPHGGMPQPPHGGMPMQPHGGMAPPPHGGMPMAPYGGMPPSPGNMSSWPQPPAGFMPPGYDLMAQQSGQWGQWPGTSPYNYQDQSYKEWFTWWQSYSSWYNTYFSGWNQQSGLQQQPDPSHYKSQGLWSSAHQQYPKPSDASVTPTPVPSSPAKEIKNLTPKASTTTPQSKGSHHSTIAKTPVSSAATATASVVSSGPKLKFPLSVSFVKESSSSESKKAESSASKSSGTDQESEHNLWVGNLPLGTCAVDVRTLISTYGKVVKCRVGGMKSQRGAGLFALVTMESAMDAAVCIQMLHGSFYNGQKIVVSKVQPQ